MGTTTTVIGTGILTWDRSERVSDRYGTIGLLPTTDGSAAASGLGNYSRYQELPAAEPLAGQVGTLVARVLETRESQHIGDIFRGLSPETPEVGEQITLGTGRLFLDRGGDGGELILGLDPDDGRSSDWLDPRALYRCHSQTIELAFTPAR